MVRKRSRGELSSSSVTMKPSSYAAFDWSFSPHGGENDPFFLLVGERTPPKRWI